MFERSAGWAYRVTNEKTYPFSDKSLAHIEASLPPLLWETSEDLDILVMGILRVRLRWAWSPITGAEIAMLCGASKRTIRRSIGRLRKAGYKIDGSVGPPKGYRLEEEDE